VKKVIILTLTWFHVILRKSSPEQPGITSCHPGNKRRFFVINGGNLRKIAHNSFKIQLSKESTEKKEGEQSFWRVPGGSLFFLLHVLGEGNDAGRISQSHRIQDG
jgi:hypothetical protein